MFNGLMDDFKIDVRKTDHDPVPGRKAPGAPAFQGTPRSYSAMKTGWKSASAVRCARLPARPTPSSSKSAENTDEARYSPGERYASIYEINMLRCIFCGYCEDACPTEAIVLGDNYELSFVDRRSSIYTKDMLIEPVAPGGQPTPQKTTPGVFTRSVPEMQNPTD